MAKPIRIDVARLNYNKKKICTCTNPHYEVDVQNRLVECTDCGAIIDPFEALVDICKHWHRVNEAHEAMMAEREAVAGYEPRLKVIKELAARYSGKSSPMVPRCPHCSEPFEVHDLLTTSWCSRKYLKLKQERER